MFTKGERLQLMIRPFLGWTLVDEVRVGEGRSRDSQTLIQEEAVEGANGDDFSMPVVEDVTVGRGEFVLGQTFHASPAPRVSTSWWQTECTRRNGPCQARCQKQ